MWSTAFAALSLAARLACVDTDPERLSCPIPDEVALRLAVRDESVIDPEILSHIGDETPASDIPMNLPDGRWNTMMQGVVGSRSCGRDPADLSTRDLQSAFHDTQGVMMRSAASGGSVWKRLLDAGYDFNSFVNSYNQAIDRRGQPAP